MVGVVTVVAVMAVVVVVVVLWLPLDLQVSTGKLVLLSRCKTAFAQVVVVVSRWWVWCPGGG